jgi:D-glycero-D-manno-heptose 1,7-bisphosphate phosphatase
MKAEPKAATSSRTSGEKGVAVFLDRDGTLCEEVGYLDSPAKIRLIPGAAEAIRLLNENGLKAVLVTNQSGVARGFFSETRLGEIHRELCRMLRAEGASLAGVYYCPHHPTEGKGEYLCACDCRKPASGLIRRAAADLGLDLGRSYCVGDRLADLECGRQAGAKGILVLTGYGKEESSLAGTARGRGPFAVAPSLREAVRWILDDLRKT